MDLSTIFLTLSIIQGFITQAAGIYFILKGNYKPQRMTRLLYMLLNGLILASLFVQGSWVGFWLSFAQSVGGAIIFVLSIKYGMGGTTKLDLFTLAGVVVTAIVWKTTNNALLALVMSILTDAIAFIPTIEKTWRLPETEDWRFYMSDVLASGFNLLALSSWALQDSSYPLYIFVLNTTGVLLILGRTWAKNRIMET